MPTLDEWEQALSRPRLVRVESSQGLLQEVRQRHSKKDAKRQQSGQAIPPRKDNITVVPAFDPTLDVPVIPAYLLHRLGVVTTPQIENLADICSTWAYFRYLWAFDIPSAGEASPTLRLSDAARNIDFHQKGLLSDQIGVGMAALLLGIYLNAPLAADVSVAMDDPTWPIDLEYETSPDYIFFDSTQANLFIVECKGTQTTRYASVDQLRRGTEQVPSLSFTDGRMPPSLVVATCLSKEGTRVLVIDPPGDEDSGKHSERSERVGPREWKVLNDAEFGRATRLLSDVKLLSFAGADQAAAEKLDRAHTRRTKTPRIVPRVAEISENEFGSFRGVRQRVGLKDRFHLDVFQALDTTVFDALVSEEPDRAEEELRAFKSRTALASGVNVQSPQAVLTTHERDTLVVRSAGPDGSLLEIRVSPN